MSFPPHLANFWGIFANCSTARGEIPIGAAIEDHRMAAKDVEEEEEEIAREENGQALEWRISGERQVSTCRYR